MEVLGPEGGPKGQGSQPPVQNRSLGAAAGYAEGYTTPEPYSVRPR